MHDVAGMLKIETIPPYTRVEVKRQISLEREILSIL
jgi:hypothetical protein